jgi:hypothetical protein
MEGSLQDLQPSSAARAAFHTGGVALFSVSLDLTAALASPEGCPACGSPGLRVEVDPDGVRLICPRCRRRWDPELGLLTLTGRDSSPSIAQHAGAETTWEP